MNQTIFAAPIILLYFLSIGIAWLVGPKSAKADDIRRRVIRPIPLTR